MKEVSVSEGRALGEGTRGANTVGVHESSKLGDEVKPHVLQLIDTQQFSVDTFEMAAVSCQS